MEKASENTSFKRSIGGYKSSLTRHCNDATILMEDEVVPSTQDEVKEYLRILSAKYNTLVEAVENAITEGSNEDWNPILDEGQKLYQATQKKIKSYLADITTNSTNSNQTVLPTEQSEDPSKACTDKFLQPFVLTKDHNPSELQKWKKQVSEYFQSGNIFKQSANLQQAYLYRCLDDDIAERLEAIVSTDATIEECMVGIENIFKTIYPLLTRCHRFHQMKPEGEDSVKYMARIKRANKEADMKSLTENDLAFPPEL